MFFFFWGGGAEIQRNATLSQSIALRSAIVGRENFDRRWFFFFIFFVFLYVCFFGFYFIFIIFLGEGVG